MQALAGLSKKWLLILVSIAFTLGTTLDVIFGTQIDYWLHDAALVYQARQAWQHTAIVVLDDKIPAQVTRLQALPLYARAVEKLVATGVKGIFLDASNPKKIEDKMPYAQCVETNGDIRWSLPMCNVNGLRCELGSSPVGNAPLKMAAEVWPLFRVAPYLPGQQDLPDFLLYDLEAEAFIPPQGLVAADRLVRKHSAIARWMDLSEEHAAVVLANFIDPQLTQTNLFNEARESCDQNLPCRRMRFSRPIYSTEISQRFPILPVSQLAACDDTVALKAASFLKGRVVILQLTGTTEATDVHVTPFTTAFYGPNLLTPGSQYLADAVETLLNNDYPRAPSSLLKTLLFLFAALLGGYVGVYVKYQRWLWGSGFLVFLISSSLCFVIPLQQLWPITATLISFIAAALGGIALHLVIGIRQTRILQQYMPQPVSNLLLSLKEHESFRNKRCQAIVLMSDLTGYTTVTGILQEPAPLLELMNDYLNETAYVLQERYAGWLESYIGDMVCYYWPFIPEQQMLAYQNVLTGALELAERQKQFFLQIKQRYQTKFTPEVLQNISQVINAGIGVTAGTVVMGDLGPQYGVRKFGILGDPMNLTARVEALTRYFNTEIIITAEFLTAAAALGYPTRRLGRFCVKGRLKAEMLYALGPANDPRWQDTVLRSWENWLSKIEQGLLDVPDCPALFQLDQASFYKWQCLGLLHVQEKTWYLDGK